VNLPIRVRLTGAFAASTALVAVIGAVVFTNLVREGLLNVVDTDLRVRAAPLVQAVQHETPASDLPMPADLVAQVFDPSGRAVRSSTGLRGSELVGAAQRRATSAQARYLTVRRQEDTRVLATPVERSDGRWLVVVGLSLGPLYDLAADVALDLSLGAAAITVLGAVGGWLLAGAALRPVERLRRGVAEISERDPESSLMVPATRDELAALASTMNELLGRLRAGVARERRLVSDAAHELRTPLAILRTELELARRPGRTREELAEAVAGSSSEVGRLIRIADDLLLLASFDEGVALEIWPAEKVAPILKSAAALAGGAAAARGVRITVDVPDELAAAVDPGRIRQAVDNLVSNALRQAPPGSEVGLAAREEGGSVVIEVTDEGPGFPLDFLPYAFVRFRRADPGRSRGQGGTGLGLALVRAIAQGHGGDAGAGNRDRGGARVWMTIPKAR
jgi:signal transduction histidine kinase